MKHCVVVLALFLVWLCYLSTPSLAAKCSGVAICRACKNCSACKHCAKDGGTCSVCRPELYRRTPAPVNTSPAQSTATCIGTLAGTTPEGKQPSLDADMAEADMADPMPARPAQAKTRSAAAKASLSVPQEFTARCVGVTVGDTIKVLLVSGQTIERNQSPALRY